MKPRISIAAALLACASFHAHAQLVVHDPLTFAQAFAQVQAWQKQWIQMKLQIDSMTGDRGMSRLLPGHVQPLPSDWAQSMTQLSSLARQIRQSQAILTSGQAARMSGDLQQFLSQAQDISAANQAMSQQAFNDAALRQTRLQTLTSSLASTRDPKAAYDLANRIAIEHAELLKDQNQLEAAANGASAQERAQRLMKEQMRASSFGLQVPKIDASLP